MVTYGHLQHLVCPNKHFPALLKCNLTSWMQLLLNPLDLSHTSESKPERSSCRAKSVKMPLSPLLSLMWAPCFSPSVSDRRVLLQGGTECSNLLGQPLHHWVLQLGLVGAVETVERIRIVQRVHLHTDTWQRFSIDFLPPRNSFSIHAQSLFISALFSEA